MATPSYQAPPPPPPSYQAPVAAAPASEPVSGGMKILLYLLSFFIPIVGFIMGFIYYTKTNPQEKAIGKTCIILAIVSIVLTCVCYFAYFALMAATLGGYGYGY